MTTFGRILKSPRRRASMLMSAVAVVLVVTSAAWACTTVRATLTVTTNPFQALPEEGDSLLFSTISVPSGIPFFIFMYRPNALGVPSTTPLTDLVDEDGDGLPEQTTAYNGNPDCINGTDICSHSCMHGGTLLPISAGSTTSWGIDMVPDVPAVGAETVWFCGSSSNATPDRAPSGSTATNPVPFVIFGSAAP